MSLPSVAVAQNSTEKSFEEQTNLLANQFFPITCKEKLPKVVETLQECYRTIPDSDKKIISCLIFDKYVANIIEVNNQHAHNKIKETYPKKTIDFMNNYNSRLKSHFLEITKEKPFSFDRFNDFINDSAQRLSIRIDNLYTITKLQNKQCIKNEFSQYSFWGAFSTTSKIKK